MKKSENHVQNIFLTIFFYIFNQSEKAIKQKSYYQSITIRTRCLNTEHRFLHWV